LAVIASGVIAVALSAGGIYYAFNSGAVAVRTAALISLPILFAGLFAVMCSRFVTTALLAVAFWQCSHAWVGCAFRCC
jgi:hypothetical protein